MLQVSLSNKLKVKPIKYEQIHPDNWIDDKEAQDRYRELCLKVREWPRDDDDAASNANGANGGGGGHMVDEIQMMLMALVMLFSSDFIELDDPSRVASVQTKYAAMLYRYLKTKYKDGSQQGTTTALAKFCQGMFVSSMSREMREIKELHWKN